LFPNLDPFPKEKFPIKAIGLGGVGLPELPELPELVGEIDGYILKIINWLFNK